MNNYSDTSTLIDIEAALESSQCTMEELIDIMHIFYDTIDQKSEEIKTCLINNDIVNYTIYVHALKSASKLIGANNLAEKAYYFEKCGKENNIDEIKSGTDELLSDYKALKEAIEPIIASVTETSDIDKYDLLLLLNDLKEFLNERDVVMIHEYIKQLNQVRFNDDFASMLKTVTSLTYTMDYTECIHLIDEFEKKLLS